jgi:tetratricopeptide (TPR) repeat protein
MQTRPIAYALTLAAVLAAAPTPSRAADAEVRGLVTTMDGSPLEGVVVEFTAIGVASKPFVVKTRKDGTYVFPFLPYSQNISYAHTYTITGYKLRHYKVVSRQPRSSADRGEGTVIQEDDSNVGPDGKAAAVRPKPGGTVRIEIQMITEAEYQDLMKQRAAAAAAKAEAESIAAGNAPAAPALPVDPVEKARALAGSGKTGEAMQVLQDSIAQEPTAVKWLELGRLQAASDDSSAATRSYSRAAGLDPSLKGVHLQIGKLLADEGRVEEATAELEKERDLQPDDTATLRALASLYTQVEKKPEAIAFYERITAPADASPDLLTRLGALYRETGQSKKAEEIYQRIAVANPKDSDQMYYKMGRSIMDQKSITEADRRRAVEAFRKAIEVNPKNALAHRELGYALLGLGDLPGAKTHLKEFLALKPDDKDAGEVRAMLKDLG